MALFRVRYAGPKDLVIEASSSVEAEMEAANLTESGWFAEEIWEDVAEDEG